MRHLILTTAAILAIAGATTSGASAAKHHHASTLAPADAGSAPADSMDAHAARAKNLRDAGYDAKKDMDANGNIRQN